MQSYGIHLEYIFMSGYSLKDEDSHYINIKLGNDIGMDGSTAKGDSQPPMHAITII